MSKLIIGIITAFIGIPMFAVAPAEPQFCHNHSECPSGVCDHFKKDNGICAPMGCKEGEHKDNNNYYCDYQGKWQKRFNRVLAL